MRQEPTHFENFVQKGGATMGNPGDPGDPGTPGATS